MMLRYLTKGKTNPGIFLWHSTARGVYTLRTSGYAYDFLRYRRFSCSSTVTSWATGLTTALRMRASYVRYNIPGNGTASSLFEDTFEGCRCEGSCDDSCHCISRFGRTYDNRGRLANFDPYSARMKPIYECNRSCRCPPTCANRVVQRGVEVELMVFPTERKGLGVRCLTDVERDTFICEYAGEIVSAEVARTRTRARRHDQPNYILTVSEHMTPGADGDGVVVTYVDPTLIGNVGRFINHSCEPNLYMVPVRVDNVVPHLALFALRDIRAGEEICYDYSGSVQRPPVADCQALQEIKDADAGSDGNGFDVANKKECYCGSSACRQYLPFEESLYAV